MMEAMDDWPQQGQTTRAASTLGGGPHTLSEALRAILYPNESAHTLFKRARTKPFRTGLEIFDLAEQFMYGGAAPPPPADNSNESSERDLVHSHSGREEISASAGGEASTSTSNRGGIRGGDVVEFYGKTGSGKTEMLLHIVASTILPSTWSPSSTSTTTSSSSSSGGSHQRLELDGEGAGAIFFDNDLKFDILRLERVLRARIRVAVAKLRQQRAASRQKKTTRSHRGAASSRKRQRVSDDDEAEEEEDEEAEWPSAEDEDELVRACLARLTVFRCEDSLQFLATLQMTDELIRNYAHTQQQQQPRQPPTSTTSTAKGKEKETRQNGAAAAAEVKVIVIDSIGAFHNADRYAEPYGGGGGFGGKGGYYGGGSRSRMNKVVLALKQLVNAHNLIVFAGKGAPSSL